MMEGEGELATFKLPARRRGTYLGKMRKTSLLTNLYKVEFDENSTINIYSVKTIPDLAHDSTQRLNSVIQSARKALEPHVGCTYMIIQPTSPSADELSIPAT